MTGDGRDREIGLWPGLMQLVRGDRGRRNVIATLHDDRRNACQPAGVRDQLTLGEPPAMKEIMVFNTREGQGECRRR